MDDDGGGGDDDSDSQGGGDNDEVVVAAAVVVPYAEGAASRTRESSCLRLEPCISPRSSYFSSSGLPTAPLLISTFFSFSAPFTPPCDLIGLLVLVWSG